MKMKPTTLQEFYLRGIYLGVGCICVQLSCIAWILVA